MQTKMLLIAPLVILPLITLLAWVAGVGKEPVTRTTVSAQLPAPVNPIQHLFTKADFYDQAAKDSARYLDHPKDTIPTRVAASVARLQAVLAPPPPPQTLPQQTPPPMPPPAPAAWSRPKPPPPEPDTSLDRLSLLLDKVIAIQHPETVHPPETVDSQRVNTDAATVTPAVTETEGDLITGESIALRLEGDLKVKGWKVPEGTVVYGIVSLDNERLRIHIRSILSGSHILSTNLEAYDLDGQEGIYVPGSLDRDVVKSSTDQALGTLGLTTLDPTVGAQAAGVGIQTLKSLLSRKVRQVRVTVREGYRVLIK